MKGLSLIILTYCNEDVVKPCFEEQRERERKTEDMEEEGRIHKKRYSQGR